MTPELKLLEFEIFPQRKSKRIHTRDLQAAWAAYIKTLERPGPQSSLGWRVVAWLKKSVGG